MHHERGLGLAVLDSLKMEATPNALASFSAGKQQHQDAKH